MNPDETMEARRGTYASILEGIAALKAKGWKELPTSYSKDLADEAQAKARSFTSYFYQTKVMWVPPNPDANINALDNGRYIVLTLYRFGRKS